MKNANPFVAELVAAGYQTCFSILDLSGTLMTPGGPGVPEPEGGCEVQVLHDRIRVFTVVFVGEPHTRRSYHDTKTVAVFDTVASFLAWCREHGQISEPGQPAWSQGGID